MSEEKRRWFSARLNLMPGDVLSSKKGMLFSSDLTGEEKFYTAKRVKYLGNNIFEVIGEKQPEYVFPIDVKSEKEVNKE